MINDKQLKQLVEAAIFSSEQPVTIDQLLTGVLAQYSLNKPRIRQVIDQLQNEYNEKGVNLVELASGYRFQTRPELGPALSQMWAERAPRYSAALMETLALIAWRQPITRGEIEAVRGVSVSTQIMKTLQERGWVKVVGHKEVPGRPALFATTKTFLDYFSIQSVADIPALAEPPESDTRERDNQEEIPSG
ncbi:MULTISPECIES: SMC-Scp complex subunit ScpB [Gammaproteobacteria]|uniref:SMC-Scp complex subunit ScpB n=1 Tax=Gammaproteobacteria TaxID=1236 RepID=UPI000DD0A08B|nr:MULTISPECIES: SMC-Scp complex subunit ScpB [Gammaproteobacteria]RTE87565.1 SMC-Scp complex subunit ScpB [Aliidiomarina sp. B3213]TCZ92651.1 SMC-Scp complex subunit ScpB [Lysobacter sp. N42]